MKYLSNTACKLAGMTLGQETLMAANAGIEGGLGEPSGCVRLYERAIELLSGEGGSEFLIASAYNSLGVCKFQNDISDSEAEAAFDRAIGILERLPGQASELLLAVVRQNMAERQARCGQKDEAADMLRKASAVFQRLAGGGDSDSLASYVDCQESLGRIYCQIEEYRQGEICYSRAIAALGRGEEVRRQRAALLDGRARARLELGNFAAGLKDYSLQISILDDLPDHNLPLSAAFFGRALCLEKLGALDKMVGDMQKSIDLTCDLLVESPDSDIFLDALIQQYQMLGHGREALEEFEDAAYIYGLAAKLIVSSEEANTEEREFELAQTLVKQSSCFCKCEAALYYDALKAYSGAIKILGALPPSPERDSAFAGALIARGELLELAGEVQLAKNDYRLAGELFGAGEE